MTTSGGRRDPQALRSGLLAWCETHRPDLAERGIDEVSHAAAGWSNETIVVRFHPGGNGSPPTRLVVRMPPVLASFPDLDLDVQATVQNVVGGLGVPTAAPTHFERDSSWIGSPFLVMPFMDGTIPGEASLFDPWLTEATEQERRSAQREMVRTLSDIHDLDWRSAGLGELLVGGSGGLDEQLRWWGDYLKWAMGDLPMPRIEAAFEWCRTHRPDDEVPLSLVWGDPRLGNLVVGPDRQIRAVLDWELAAIGPAEMDLGWYLGLERVLHELMGREPLAGFADPETVAADYEEAVGRALVDLGWHQIFAVLRSISINVRQASIAAESGVRYMVPAGEANPLLAVVEGWIDERMQP